MQTLNVDLGERSYPIYIGAGLLQQDHLLSPYIKGQRTVVVSNETVAPLYLNDIHQHLNDYRNIDVILPDGEQFKTQDSINTILTDMLKARCDRSTTVIALGGGVIGDMTGFAAACYQRGVNFIQIPTTLLAQVDSSVGGKTGINHPLGKNMIGAFHQPQCVLIDTNTLETLDDQQLSSGMAEVIKYGLIRDNAFLQWLQNNTALLMQRDPQALAYAIYRSCQHKAEVVAADEKEAGQRALLNLGHTFGHAIETSMGYGQWLHGEAVAVGMLMAAQLSQLMGWLKTEDVILLRDLLLQANLPTKPPAELSEQVFREKMSLDKKVQNGVLHFVLLKPLGEAILSSDYDEAALQTVLNPTH